MGWFEEQLEVRRKSDQKILEDSFIKLTDVLLGERVASRMHDECIVSQGTIDEILKYYHYRPVKAPDSITSAMERLDYCLKPYGLMRRNVELTEGWYKDAIGPLIAHKKGETAPIALLPGKGVSKYYYNDRDTGEQIWIDRKRAQEMETDAICFYKSLPMRRLGLMDLIHYMCGCINLNDRFMLVLSAFVVTLIGLMLPSVTRALTGPVLSSGRTDALVGILVCILCVSVSSQLFGIIKALLKHRLTVKMGTSVMAAMIMRMISLPASFFRRYSPGELRSRVMSVTELCMVLMGVVMSASVLSLTSLLYVVQIFHFAPVLVIPSVIIISATIAFSILVTQVRIRRNKKQMEQAAVESGMTYSLISGVQKIKLTGSEKRVFGKWLDFYVEGVNLKYNLPLVLRIEKTVTLALSLISTIVLYLIAAKSGMEPSSYYAFSAAYGAVMGSLASMNDTTYSAAQIRPILEQAEPFLQAEPESAEGKENVTDISGAVELSHIWFRYDEKSPYILKDLSLKVEPGDYVAIVGKSGCGKSTLIRLLLGFEEPEHGAVYYDGKDLSMVDHSSLRRRIGTVLQAGGLFNGDIYSNIVITSPELSMDEAWHAAEIAGIADDIRAMPMGMHTLIGEGMGGISGGQRQRLMIARAVAPKPKLLILDEATSALDNKTQRQVSEALDKMGCTRIVIAHRLSTIRHCERILVLDEGRIVEDGTYDELIEKGGYFAGLVERQRLEEVKSPGGC